MWKFFSTLLFVAFSCLWLGVSMASAQGFFPDEQPSGGGPTRGWGGGPTAADIDPAIDTFNQGVTDSVPNHARTTEASTAFTLISICQLIAGEMCYRVGGIGFSDYEVDKGVSDLGAIGGATKLISGLYSSPPASSQTYVADLLYNSNIVTQPAYAQGLGFASLDPILETWKVFRNLSYLMFVLVFIVIGFLIMFRTKVGQAAITAQQAVPQIIVALVMVTFSYAIAGLLIDLMYLSMYVIVGVFGGDQALISLNIFQLGMNFIKAGWDSFGVINEMIEATLSSLGGLLAKAFSFLGGVIFLIVISTAILINIFRLFFELLKSYIAIILSIVFAPILLMVGAIPGKNTFSGWIWSLVGNLSVFPTVLLIMVVYQTIVFSSTGSGGFMPPYLMGRGTSGVITGIIGLGMILALPEIVAKIKGSMGAKDTFGWLTGAIFKSFKQGEVGIPLATGAYGAAQGAITAGRASLREKPEHSLLTHWKNIREGYDEFDDDGKYVRTRGGIGPRARSMYGRGQNIRKVIDDFAEGRLAQPDNWRQLLENIAPKKEKPEKKPKIESE